MYLPIEMSDAQYSTHIEGASHVQLRDSIVKQERKKRINRRKKTLIIGDVCGTL